jgi:hypothetical protein
MRPLRILLPAFVFAAALGCRRGDAAGPVSDSTFVAVLADLRRANARTELDSTRRAAVRDSIMRHYRVTTRLLEQTARRLATSPERAQEIWSRIEARQRDTTAASPATAPPDSAARTDSTARRDSAARTDSAGRRDSTPR